MKKVAEESESISYYLEYVCPGCGTLLELDVYCPRIDADTPLWDIDIKL